MPAPRREGRAEQPPRSEGRSGQLPRSEGRSGQPPRSEGRSGHGLGGRFLSLTTYRRDGRPVPTTVWFTREGSRLWVWTRADSGKVRRLRANAAVTVAQSDAKGRVQGPVLHGTATVDGPPNPTADDLFGHKYGLVLKVWRRVHALVRRAGRGHDWVYVRIDLDP